MYNLTVLSVDGTLLRAEEATYHLDPDQKLLTIEAGGGTNFFNWNHVIYFGASPVGA
jgi:hypothetical protein